MHTLKFPPQEHKLGPGLAHDPATGKNAGEIVSIDDAEGILRLKRGPKLAAAPFPKALIAEGPYGNRDQRDAIFRMAESIRDGDGRYPALQAILGREQPRFRGLPTGGRLQTTDPAGMKALALGLDGSYLFVQGPPGTGKTWTGACLVVYLLAQGKQLPVPPPPAHDPDPRMIRRTLGLSQTGFARAKGISAKTLHKWEQGTSRPSGAARTLLRVAASEPSAVKRALAAW